MKTIEQKAQAYDEALERARDYHEKGYFMINAAIEKIFPGLKESDDERIRKTLVELVKCNERSGYKLLNNIPTSSMLAWLEKQKPVDVLDEEERVFADNVDAWREEMDASYKDGFNEARKQFLNKACEWLYEYCRYGCCEYIEKNDFIEDFRKAMEE